MNYRMTFFILGYVMNVVGVLMVLPLGVALLYGEYDAGYCFAGTIAVLVACGLALTWKKPDNKEIFAKEGFLVVALSWLLMSFFAALPFYFSGAIPSALDCFFEAVSGLTTTGASILSEIESLPRSILFWRSFTHWIGGMGVLVFILAVVSLAGGNTLYLMRAESPGPSHRKLVPKVNQTAKILYSIYIFLTLLQMALLLAGGMSLYDSVVHAFSTAGTGGFSVRNASIAAYDSAYIQGVFTVFMMLFGVNFNVFYFLLIRKFTQALGYEELRIYLGIIIFAIVTIVWNITGPIYDTVGESFRYASFQVTSIISSTGYMTADFNQWPQYSRTMLMLLMFVGACAGSTGGGIKVARFAIMVKTAAREIRHLLHPRAVTSVTFCGKPVEEDTIKGTFAFLVLYFFLLAGCVLILSFDQADLETIVSASVSCINNIGPGLGMVGPVENYGFWSPLSKAALIFIMLAGRLEIFPIIMLLAPGVWRRGKTAKRRRRYFPGR